MKEIEGIVFDMDGVLIDSMYYHAISFEEALGDMGIDIDKDEIYMLEGKGAETAIKNILEDRGIEPNEYIIEELVERKRKIFNDMNEATVFEGMEKTVESLKKEFRLGLVTGSNRDTVEEFVNKYFKDIFDIIITEEDTENKKPNPDPFEKSIQKLGLNKENVLVVENAPLGVLSAKEAGIKCWAVATYVEKNDLKEAGADKVFNNHEDLIKSLENLTKP